jgi:hypothetical protein
MLDMLSASTLPEYIWRPFYQLKISTGLGRVLNCLSDFEAKCSIPQASFSCGACARKSSRGELFAFLSLKLLNTIRKRKKHKKLLAFLESVFSRWVIKFIQGISRNMQQDNEAVGQ